MKKFGLQTIIILVLGFLAHRFFPFWAIAPVGALTGLFFNHKNSMASFMAGFVAASLLWGGYAGFVNSANANLLTGQLGPLFKMDAANLTYYTGVIGGVLCGLGALTGTLARKIFEKEEPVATA